MNNGVLNIIFVDDEQRILDGLRRQLRVNREKWLMRFALSGDEALSMLQTEPADIVVTDLRMPGMSGGHLLRLVLEAYPATARIVLTGQTDQTGLVQDVSCIHQFLQKPCETTQLCHAIERTITLSRKLAQPQLRLAVSRITALPPAPESHRALVAELCKDDADVARVAGIVGRDPALTVKLIQLVNSAFYGLPRKVAAPRDAIVMLGLATLKAIVLTSRIFEFVDTGSKGSPYLSKLWNDSFEIGEFAARLAKMNGAPEAVQESARLAGMLSRIGRGILMTAEPAVYARMMDRALAGGRSLAECESEAFGASQDDVTAYALGLWAYSDEMVAAAAYQSAPSRMPGPTPHHPVGYVHLARALQKASADLFLDQPAMDEAFALAQKFSSAVLLQRRKAG